MPKKYKLAVKTNPQAKRVEFEILPSERLDETRFDPDGKRTVTILQEFKFNGQRWVLYVWDAEDYRWHHRVQATTLYNFDKRFGGWKEMDQ